MFLTLQNEYRRGNIVKRDFVEKASQIHNILFEYSEALSGTNIQSINIKQDGVFFDFGGYAMKMYDKDKGCAPLGVFVNQKV